MDQYKMEMNWNQEEMEQWVLAYRQKEADNLALEKYKRHDEAQIKKLRLEIQKLTSEVTRNQNKLEREITETQAAQIELDRTAEEFKRQHEERADLFNKWDIAQKNVARRGKQLEEETEKFRLIHQQTITVKTNLENEKEKLQLARRDNEELKVEIDFKQREIHKLRKHVKQQKEIKIELDAKVEIIKNQLSAFGIELQNKQTKYQNSQQTLLNNKQRLKKTQKSYTSQKRKYDQEVEMIKRLKIKNFDAKALLESTKKEKKAMDYRYIQENKAKRKAETELYAEKEKEASLYSQIQGTMAACKNLQSGINKLAQEFQRQQELLYQSEYQIQLMERHVSFARGEVNHEEAKELIKRKEEVESQLTAKQEERTLIEKSLKQLKTDIKKSKREIARVEESRQKIEHMNYELKLQNEMASQDVAKVIKEKEDTLVRHDCRALEIKKIYDVLMNKTDEVFNLENKKNQVEMSMQEREKEIQLHKDILIAEHKAAVEERHKVQVQLSQQKSKVNNHKIKYESLIQKNKPSDGEMESAQEHSQAYYVIKAAQEKEELQRKGDELHAEIMKNKKEIKALDNTLKHLKNRNAKYRDSFQNKGTTRQDLARKKRFEDNCRAANENLFRKRKKLEKLEKEFNEDTNRLKEIHAKLQVLQKHKDGANIEIEKLIDQFPAQERKIARAKKTLKIRNQHLEAKSQIPGEDNPHMIEVRVIQQQNLTKTYFSAIYALSNDFPELANILEGALSENQIGLPEKEPSVIDVHSVTSSRSGGSQRSRRSERSR